MNKYVYHLLERDAPKVRRDLVHYIYIYIHTYITYMAYILQIYVQILTNMYITCSSGMPPKCDEISSMCGSIALAHSAGETWAMGWQGLAYTRYCHCLYGIVHGIQMGGRGRVRYCAIDVQKLCSADGSTHTESNKLYRKVKHRYRPKSFSTPTANGQIAP